LTRKAAATDKVPRRPPTGGARIQPKNDELDLGIATLLSAVPQGAMPSRVCTPAVVKGQLIKRKTKKQKRDCAG